jgi:hypothetical protein
MWAWEQAHGVAHDPGEFWFDPLPYARTGSGLALDGLPKFDLSRFDERYYDRLHERVGAAARRGIHVAVMLFQGWSVEWKQFSLAPGRNPWLGHPFHRANNMNGIDGDPAGTNQGLPTHTTEIPGVLEIQRAYLRRVVEAVGEFDTVLYEVSNEDDASAADSAWQDWVIRTVREVEVARGEFVHPALRTVCWPTPPDHASLYASPAEAISPNCPARHGIGLDSYAYDPLAGDGRKVILIDTDHVWGVGGDATWVWKSVTRGLNPIFMDPWESDFVVTGPFDVNARDAMGVACRLADEVDLATLLPRADLSSSRYALADEGITAAIVFSEQVDPFTFDLRAAAGARTVTWLHPTTGLWQRGTPVEGGALALLRPPFADGRGAVALLRRA